MPDEEHRGVVEYPIPVALVSPELDGKAARVAGSVRGTALAADGGETDSGAGARADLAEERRAREVADVMCDLEVAMRAGALSVDLHKQGEHRLNRDRRTGRTTRSGMRSRSKWARRSMWWKSPGDREPKIEQGLRVHSYLRGAEARSGRCAQPRRARRQGGHWRWCRWHRRAW